MKALAIVLGIALGSAGCGPSLQELQRQCWQDARRDLADLTFPDDARQRLAGVAVVDGRCLSYVATSHPNGAAGRYDGVRLVHHAAWVTDDETRQRLSAAIIAAENLPVADTEPTR
jgi:hypothetical protein